MKPQGFEKELLSVHTPPPQEIELLRPVRNSFYFYGISTQRYQ